MAHPTLEYIRGRRAALAAKKAEIVGENPSTMPGAEHDGKPDANAKKPDPEVKDQTMVPNSGLNTDGAGDDSKITHTNDLIAGEAALTPTKKPEVTGDADAKTAEQLAAEIISGVDAWYAAKKQAEDAQAAKAAQAKQAEDGVDNTKPTAGTPPSAGTGTAEALITDNGKEPEQTKDAIPPAKKPEITADANKPATGEGASGETAEAAKSAGDESCCKDGKCGKCAKCKAAAEAGKAQDKKAGALDMELTSDVLAKIAAVMLATEEGTKLAESLLAKSAGAEAAQKTLNFLREQSDLAEKKAEYEAGQRAAVVALLKQAADAGDEEAAAALAEAGLADGGVGEGDVSAAGDAGDAGDDGGITEIADTLDALVDSGEITEDEADQVVVELAQALTDGGSADAGGEKEAQAVDPAAASAPAPAADAAGAGADAGNAAIDQSVAVDPSQFDASSVPQGDAGDITVDDVADALDTLVDSGEITEDEADALVSEIVGGDAAGGADGAGGDEEVSPEAIATALQEAVASGELQPEEVQQVLTELEGVPAPAEGDAAAAAPAAPAADAAAAPAAAPAAVAPTDEAKTASSKLIAAINAARAAKAAK